MSARKRRAHPMDLRDVSALDRARRAARELRLLGTREPHGLSENTYLSAAVRRDLATIERAVARVLAADEANR